MDSLPYNENDGLIGFWIKDIVYVPYGTSYEDGGRYYQTNIKISNLFHAKNCSPTVKKYFGHDNKSKVQIYKNGRRWYLKENQKHDGSEIIVERPELYKNVGLCDMLRKYNGIEISLAHLMCSQINYSDQPFDILFEGLKNCERQIHCNLCTSIGQKISMSLIKIASLRIFSDPQQSILELPVNSLDSYFPEKKIGKFGMGFFSFLYWLIDHPKRSLYIYSWYDTKIHGICGYRCELKYRKENGIIMSLNILNTSVTQTGTFIYLNLKRDAISCNQTYGFVHYVNRLKYITNATIVFDVNSERQKFINKQRNDTNLVALGLRRTSHIYSEDYAKGIPLNILLGSLFVTSISTKGLSAVNHQNFQLWTTKIDLSKDFNIVVSEIIVYSVANYSNDDSSITIFLPPTTQVPVSRDDIILDPFTKQIFENSIYEGLKLLSKTSAIKILQNNLDVYSNFTANKDNKNAISSAIKKFVTEYSDKLTEREELANISKELFDADNRLILSTIQNTSQIENKIKKFVSGNDDVFLGKRVIFVKDLLNGKNADNFGLSSVLFVRSNLSKNKDWYINICQSMPQLYLTPIGTNLNTDGEKYYVKNNPLLNATISLYFGLSIYFNDINKFAKDFIYECVQYHRYLGDQLLYIIIEKFQKFKGNQTYGGMKYNFFFNPTIHKSMIYNIKSPKLRNFTLDGIKLYFDSVQEKQLTKFSFQAVNSPLEKNRITTTEFEPIFKELLEISDTAYEHIIAIYCIKMFVSHKPIIIDQLLNFVRGDYLKLVKTIANKKFIAESILNYNEHNISNAPPLIFVQDIIYEIEAWWNITLTKTPLTRLILDVPPENRIKFKTSQLISYLFKNNIDTSTTKQFLEDLEKINNNVTTAKLQTTKLQITEIAINEGTTKPFIDAVITELIQNSVDAIRLSKEPKNEIFVSFGDFSENGFYLSIMDYVGMDDNAFLYIGIPFLSTKTPSEIVTGEMGSGFFNVYRESDLVIIETTKNGRTFISYDSPIRDISGRVIDIDRKIYCDISTTKRNSTTITIIINKPSEKKKIEMIGSIEYICRRVMKHLPIPIKFQTQQTVNQTESELLFENEQLTIIEHKSMDIPSYILTKGIPFSPLISFFKNLPTFEVISMIGSRYGLNIKHGGYVPVQSRTRLSNVSEKVDKAMNHIAFIASLNYLSSDELIGNIPNINSVADMRQLIFGHALVYDDVQGLWAITITMNFNLNLLSHPSEKMSITMLIDKCNNFVVEEIKKGLGNVKKLLDLLDKFAVDNLKTVGDKVRKNILKIVKIWIGNKLQTTILSITNEINKKPEVKTPKKPEVKTQKKSQRKNSSAVYSDETTPEYKITLYINAWVECYMKYIKKTKTKGYNIIKINDVLATEDKPYLGQYDLENNIIEINIEPFEGWPFKLFEEEIRMMESKLDFSKFKSKVWTDLFSITYPASVIPHEIEHARRHNTHSSGAHSNINDSLWPGDPKTDRTFEQCCNEIYSNFISEGMLDDLFLKFKTVVDS